MTPKHYDKKVQPIEYMQSVMTKEEFKGFCKGNVIKYLSRADQKGGINDYRKALVYMDWLETFVTQEGDLS